MVQNIKNGKNSPNEPWLTGSRVDPGLKDPVLYGILRRPRCYLAQHHPDWHVLKS
jgi:hypothetical protein